LSCRDVVEFLDGYLSGELPSEMRERFLAHLALCRACRNYMETYQATIRAVRHLHDCADAAADVPDELVRVILASRAKESP
jgi:anti-sigma factor RsiW